MWTLLKAETVLSFAQFRRYFFNSLLSLGIMVLFFYGLFYGIALFVNAPLGGNSLSSLVLGFVVWTFTLGILHGIAQDIQTEATRPRAPSSMAASKGCNRPSVASLSPRKRGNRLQQELVPDGGES